MRSEERELFSRDTLGPLANACNANKICGGQYELGAPRRELVHRGSLAGRITKCTKHRKDKARYWEEKLILNKKPTMHSQVVENSNEAIQ